MIKSVAYYFKFVDYVSFPYNKEPVDSILGDPALNAGLSTYGVLRLLPL